MSQLAAIHKILKSTLKAHGISYADLGRSLGLSEASIKRLFSNQGFSLQRLDQICEVLGVEMSDLFQQLHQESELDQLTERQEQDIVADTAQLLVTVCVLNRWTLADIVERYNLDELTCIRKLALLDRLGLIDLLPANRIRLNVASNFRWRENGPIQRFFQSKIQQEFFATRFDLPDEHLLVLNGMLSVTSQQALTRKLHRLQREFDALNLADRHLAVGERTGVTLVMASRSWRYGVFAPYRRDTPAD